MNEQELIDNIIAEARQEAGKIIDEAKYEYGKIIEADKAKNEKELQKQIEKYQEEMEIHKENEISVCELEARNQILAEKQKWIKKVKKDVQNKIENTNGKEYITLIQEMLENAKPKENGVILLPAKQIEQTKELAKQKGLQVEQVNNFEAGFVLKYGNVEENYILDTMLELENDKVNEIIANILFG